MYIYFIDDICFIIYYSNMDDKLFEIYFYTLPDGSEPVKNFLDSLDIKMRAKMLWTINLLKQNGTNLRLPYSEFLEDGIFELRAKQSSNISRVLYFFFRGKKVILTNGFIKKTKKTPKDQIAIAKKYKSDWEKNNKEV